VPASESRPPASVNITRILANVRAFNVAASMLEASGMADEFEAQRGHGARRRRSASRATPRPSSQP
jgi:hypothetical protein